MAFKLPALPYDLSALAPTISKETLEFHHGKHHKAYVDKMNTLLESSPLKDASLEEIVKKSSGPLFNNSAQAWNHTFYWHCLSPNSGDRSASGALDKAISAAFGSREAMLKELVDKATNNFGSGWTWLVKDEAGKVSIVNTSNAETPLTTKNVPILTIDVWEHAYYIDYRNARPKYLESIQNVLNWKFVSNCYEAKEAYSATKEMKA